MNNIVKSTNYCDVLKEAKIVSEDITPVIELIRVKDLDREEIRFAYYKKDKNGRTILVPRPLDLESHDLLMLLKEAIKENIFNDDFKRELKLLL
ncbi:hypothetical protein [Bacillus sp. T33-2]|uniref:hypothetical protein n=1 Tax=Bacillus sp. T33-2 TaxID=2054168 RepID=UPI000C769A44|nr:hypothetical protein [Bacillus sp. T33-2]PLR94845.1 hypothetical protein CVD19_16360 [Bacillus sp. T33-2]